MVDSSAACTLTKDKQPAIATPCTVAMDVDAAEELSTTKANAEVKFNKRTPKKKRKETKKISENFRNHRAKSKRK